MSSIYDWDTTAANNANSDSSINFAEGQAPSTVNNSARQVMGRVAEYVQDIGGTQTAGGTADALTLTARSGFTAYANGQIVGLKAASDNTGAATLNVNGIGAKAIRKEDDGALSAGDIQQNGIHIFVYNSSLASGAGAWQILDNKQDLSLYQPLDATLTALSGVTTAADKLIYATGADTFTTTDFTGAGRALIDDASASDQRTTLGLAIGTDVQAYQAAQAQATWEAGTVTTESVVSPAKVKAAIDALSPGKLLGILEHQETSGTSVGATAGSWQTRTLNTEVLDVDSVITLSSNNFQCSVNAWVEWSAPAVNIGGIHRTRLYNVTDSTVTKLGSSEWTSGSTAQTRSFGACQIVSGKDYRVEHQVQTTNATNGFGVASSYGTEVYTIVKIYAR